jgi:DNA transformation protein and related proteins
MTAGTMLGWFRELLAPLGPVRTRAMFGGHGVYVDDEFIAVVIDDVLYLKVDDETRARFEGAGSRPFTYDAGERGEVAMSYWSAPDEALDDPAGMRPWALLALAAARRKPATKKRATHSQPKRGTSKTGAR